MTNFTDLIDLVSERLGGAVIFANDEFFAQKENLLRPNAAVFLEHEYTDRGKLMDGWETRRRRTPGHDYCIVRLGLPGIIRGVVVDTAFFRGNYPDQCSIEATFARPDTTPEELLGPSTPWIEILPQSKLAGDSKNFFEISSPYRYTHLRFNIFPDGGVARLRVHGYAVPDLPKGDAKIDVAAVESGAVVLLCSDMFFGSRHNLTMPGRAANMGDGWETRRRRGPGHDWALIELAGQSTIRRIEIDTNHFKGNYADTCMIEGAKIESANIVPEGELPWADIPFREILPRTKLMAHTRHFFEEELEDRGPFSHLRINIYPDGGVSRLRVHGTLTAEGRLAARLRRFNTLPGPRAEAEFLTCCGASAWARKMAALRPFQTLDQILDASDAACAALLRDDWLEAFRAHPRIGEQKASIAQVLTEKQWSREEQSSAGSADHETLAALREANARYDEKFGHIFIIYASGKSAEEMLIALSQRLDHSPDEELLVAAEEQRKITRLRLTKFFTR